MAIEEAFGFRIEPGSGVPVFLQFVQQVRQAVLLGYLHGGDRLPAVKDAAAAAVVNPNTVVKAYRQLELEGLVTPRPGSGTYVNSPVAAVAPRDLAAAQRALRRFFAAAEQAGLDEQAVVAMFETERRARAGREAVA